MNDRRQKFIRDRQRRPTGKHQTAASQGDLLLTCEELVALAVDAAAQHDRQDAFLAMAGVSQIIDDYLDGLDTTLHQVVGFLRDRPDGLLEYAVALGGRVDEAVAITRRTRRHQNLQRRCWDLANALVDSDRSDLSEMSELLAIRSLITAERTSLRTSLARSPSCFRSFDQHPDDMAVFVDRFAQRSASTESSILVIGLRTSGSFLAPICAHLFRQAGFTADAVSFRPGGTPSRLLRERLLAAARQGTRCILVDDPPTSGSALRRTAESLMLLGLPRTSLTMFIPLMAGETPPTALREFDQLVLPAREWSITRKLTVSWVEETLRLLVPSINITRIWQITEPTLQHQRGHFAADFGLIGTWDDEPLDLQLQARGAGLGYFGRFDQAAQETLAPRAALHLGVRDGVALVLSGEMAEPTAENMLDYIQSRTTALAAPSDRSAKLRGRQPVWEIASNEVSKVFGRLWPLARLLAVEPLVRRILRPQHLTQVDGGVRDAVWASIGDGAPQPLDVTSRSFSNLDLACYDPVYDVVGAAHRLGQPDFNDSLRDSYEAVTGTTITRDRWLAYELVHLWDAKRSRSLPTRAINRLRSAAVRSFLSASTLDGVVCPPTGQLCALDIDGVLESDAMGFPAPTTLSLLALRALCLHGYRPVLVTGRSLADAMDRFARYPVAGAVGDYGGSVAAPSGVINVLDPEERSALANLRRRLGNDPRVQLDDDRTTSLRCLAKRGTPAAQETLDAIEQALAASVHRFTVVPGDSQFDIVPGRITKAVGLQRLCDELDEQRVALAVGDTASDAPMLRMARLGAVPSHADAAAKAASTFVAPHPYQHGLADAVGQLIGHAPGSCSLCAAPARRADGALLERILSAAQGSRQAMVTELLSLTVAVRRPGST